MAEPNNPAWGRNFYPHGAGRWSVSKSHVPFLLCELARTMNDDLVLEFCRRYFDATSAGAPEMAQDRCKNIVVALGIVLVTECDPRRVATMCPVLKRLQLACLNMPPHTDSVALQGAVAALAHVVSSLFRLPRDTWRAPIGLMAVWLHEASDGACAPDFPNVDWGLIAACDDASPNARNKLAPHTEFAVWSYLSDPTAVEHDQTSFLWEDGQFRRAVMAAAAVAKHVGVGMWHGQPPMPHTPGNPYENLFDPSVKKKGTTGVQLTLNGVSKFSAETRATHVPGTSIFDKSWGPTFREFWIWWKGNHGAQKRKTRTRKVVQTLVQRLGHFVDTPSENQFHAILKESGGWTPSNNPGHQSMTAALQFIKTHQEAAAENDLPPLLSTEKLKELDTLVVMMQTIKEFIEAGESRAAGEDSSFAGKSKGQWAALQADNDAFAEAIMWDVDEWGYDDHPYGGRKGAEELLKRVQADAPLHECFTIQGWDAKFDEVEGTLLFLNILKTPFMHFPRGFGAAPNDRAEIRVCLGAEPRCKITFGESHATVHKNGVVEAGWTDIESCTLLRPIKFVKCATASHGTKKPWRCKECIAATSNREIRRYGELLSKRNYFAPVAGTIDTSRTPGEKMNPKSNATVRYGLRLCVFYLA